MPRLTSKSKAKNGNINVKAYASKNSKQTENVEKAKSIKKELALDPPNEAVTEEVFHRKSERRRVARDIFLVFEEESTSRRSRSSKKQAKPKFGHLKVEDPSKPKGLLRDIKNEPKCFLNGSNVNVILPHSVPVLKRNSKILNLREEKSLKTGKRKTSKYEVSCCGKNSNKGKSLKISTLETKECAFESEKKFVARVNPIFLWVKQDDTRIVEVRCEDYDKRNRIRITKTTNGWRAIPRSDPSTSRVLKFYPTPLMKVKREHNILETNNIPASKIQKKSTAICTEFAIQNLLTERVADEIESKLKGIDTVCNPLANKNVKSKNKKSKKKKSRAEKSLKKSKIITTAENKIAANNESVTTNLSASFSKSSANLEFPIEMTAKVESSISIQLTPDTRLYNLHGHVFKKIGESLATNAISTTPSVNVISSVTKSTYQSETDKEIFYLCPKTGLFLPNHVSITEYEEETGAKINKNAFKADKNSYLVSSKSDFSMDIDRAVGDSKLQLSDENTESLEAKTKNLKDLLDDADLLQHCDDNANSDADLIDTLVKTSCENNLIQANEIITKANVGQIEHKSLQETNEMVVQLIGDVSNPPKCLSFNEAGEIEGLNEDLFQSTTFLEAFDKQSADLLRNSQVTLHSTTPVVEAPLHKTSLYESIGSGEENIEKSISEIQTTSEIEESPKDLSYRKREEVCPQSESRSQCAVTSSSDVIKSPQNEDSTSLGSQSETLKNLILEQFMKLNALTAQHQREPIDLDTLKHSDISNMKSVYTSKPTKSVDILETVVIDDDENESEEPLKKRTRLNKHKVISESAGKLAMIDKDPDPLTQLRLLVRNTQWKVPDPILVPKDRLSAVLASPAREIPLLITTRPELRLPEAFAYPEIIQNPNILVISMAQLEAILKNDVEMEKSTTIESVKTTVNDFLSGEQISGHLTKRANELEFLSSSEHFQRVSKPGDIFNNTRKSVNNLNIDKFDMTGPLPVSRENSKISQTGSCSTDLSSSTMKVLNQMFWLPYFGHISQDIGKSINNAISLQEKCSNSVTSYNSQFSGISNLEEVSRSTNINKTSEKSLSNDGWQNFHQQFKTNEELSLFQKIVQHQMQSVLQLNQLPAASSKVENPVTQENTSHLLDKSKSKIEPSNLLEQRKQKVFFNNKQANTYFCKNQTNDISNNISVPEKSYNLRSSVAGRHSIEFKQYSNNSQRQLQDNKPRLTCKSLSNLLDPEHSTIPSSSCSVPYIQTLSGFLKSDNEYKRSLVESKMVNESIAEKKTQFLNNVPNVPQSQKTSGNINANIEPNNETNKQKPKSFEQIPLISDTPGLMPDANVPLWHPLFGSNTKTGYSSPWQWTTVTATGE